MCVFLNTLCCSASSVKTRYNRFFEFLERGASGDVSDGYLTLGAEIHAMSSAVKPLATQTAMATTQSCRECMGGSFFQSNFFLLYLTWLSYVYARLFERFL